jgi:uncharacterized protein YqfA (UPF0365 family)
MLEIMIVPVLAAAGDYVLYGLLVLAGLIALFAVILALNFGNLWLQAYSSGCPVPISKFVGMWLRKVTPRLVTEALIMATKAGLTLDIDKIEAHYLARGNVQNVVLALVAASKAGIVLDFDRAAAIDLAGRDVLDAVRTSVHPKVIDCPNPERGKTTIDAVSKDGIQLKARARVTVRTNLDQLVGGATEETIIARVGEGIVTTIGSAVTHKEVLANPDLISRKVLEKGLDAGTAYEILSIDTADVDVGQNIGAKLQTEQAEADKRIAQAKAEERRAMAVARATEMEALAKENRAKVILAEAEIPKGISDAFRSGNLGVLNYNNLPTIQRDTSLRERIGGPPENRKKSEGA